MGSRKYEHTTDGTWLASTNEENFMAYEEHDTREEAIAYGMSELDVEDGCHFWTGRVERVTNEELLGWVPERVITMVNEYLYDNVGGGDCDDDAFDVSKAAEDELKAYLIAWATKHDLNSSRFRMAEVQCHTFEACKATRKSDDERDANAVEVCTLPIQHDGDCDFV